jgi:hypothetical protein
MGKVGLKSLLANDATYTVKSTGATWKCTDPNGCMQENLFAEVAVDITTFIESGACGATFYGSVISRSSGTTPSPDMKDLAGPYEFNFGSASVTAVVAPTCGTGTDAQFNYKIGTYTGFAGGTVDLSKCSGSGCACKWFLDGATTAFSTDCNYTDVLKSVTGASPHTLKLEATDGFCPASATIANINVWAPPTVTAALSSDCLGALDFTYGATPGGVKGTAGYAWSFTGGHTGTSTSQGGTITSGITAKSLITGKVTLTDTRLDPLGNLACTAEATATTTAYLPIDVTITRDAAPQTCPSMTSDAVTFLGTPSGGSGDYVLEWEDGSGAALGVCAATTSCTIDPADGTFCFSQTLKLKVSDLNFGTTSCAAKTSNSYTYGKVTTVTATAN